MTSLVNPLSETPSYAYTNDGLVATQTDSNSTSSALVYNALNQLAQITNFDPSSTILSKFSSISHDASGNITAKYDSVPGLSTLTGWNNNTYDSTDQLYTSSSARTATNMNYSYTFGMDAVGNFSTIRSLSYVYNNRNEINHSGFAYDYNGNPTTWRGGTVTYDPENHLTSYGSVSCTYRADGLRASRTASSATTYYIYDPSGNLLYEATSASGVTAAYTWGPNGLVSRHVATGTNWYQFDERGNTADRTNSTGAVIEYHGSDPYGVVYDSAASSDPFKGFVAQYGYYYDSTYQMYLCGQRYYDPTYGRFINQDPIGFGGGINVFRYASNSPTGAVDPSGLEPLWYDRLANWVGDKVQVAKDFYSNALGGSAVGSYVASQINSSIDQFAGILMFPSKVGHLGEATGRFAAEPCMGNFGGVVDDAITFISAATMAGGGVEAGLADTADFYHPVTGVPFKDGFPVFEAEADVQIEPSGSRRGDFKRANAAAGYETTPEGMTWHHHQDYGRMQLVDKVIHQKTGHTGGWAIWGRP